MSKLKFALVAAASAAIGAFVNAIGFQLPPGSTETLINAVINALPNLL